MKRKSKGDDLTVILPTINEEGNIALLIRKIFKIFPQSHIIVIDDNSTDNTQKIVNRLTNIHPKLQLVIRRAKPCLTKSINTGIRLCHSTYVAWMDADLSHPPEILLKLYDTARISGCAIGSRFKNKFAIKSMYQNDTIIASFLSFILNIFIYLFLKINVRDYTSGFIVCRRSLLKSHNLVGDYGEYFIELVYYLSKLNVNIVEVYYKSPQRKYGYSKTGRNIFKLIYRGTKYIIMVIRLSLAN
ncbi:MAG: glycosyltransferase [Bacteroidota bacterium]